jgi:hypothetical protein
MKAQSIATSLPSARLTWGARAALTGTRQTSTPVKLEFPQPCEVVGAHVTVLPTSVSSPAKVVETADSVLVKLELESEGVVLTSRETEGSGIPDGFVSLASLDHLKGGRYLYWQFAGGLARLRITFAHARDVAGSLAFEDSEVAIDFFVNYAEGSAN